MQLFHTFCKNQGWTVLSNDPAFIEKYYSVIVVSLLSFLHVAKDVKACHLRLGIGAHGDGLLEVAGELTLAVVGHVDGALLARSDGLLGVSRYRAATTGHCLIDYEGSIAGVGKGERTLLHGLALGKRAEVMLRLVELDFSLFLGQGIAQRAHHHQGHHDKLFHLISFLEFSKMQSYAFILNVDTKPRDYYQTLTILSSYNASSTQPPRPPSQKKNHHFFVFFLGTFTDLLYICST